MVERPGGRRNVVVAGVTRARVGVVSRGQSRMAWRQVGARARGRQLVAGGKGKRARRRAMPPGGRGGSRWYALAGGRQGQNTVQRGGGVVGGAHAAPVPQAHVCPQRSARGRLEANQWWACGMSRGVVIRVRQERPCPRHARSRPSASRRGARNVAGRGGSSRPPQTHAAR